MLSNNQILDILETKVGTEYQLTALEAWWLGLVDMLEVDDEEDLATKQKLATSILKDFDELVDTVRADMEQRGWIKVLIACQYKQLLEKLGKQLIPQVIVDAWVSGKLFTVSRNYADALLVEQIVDPALLEDLEIGSVVLGTLTLNSKEQLQVIKEKQITIVTNWDLATHSFISMSREEWGNFFKSIATMHDEEEEDVFCLPSTGFMSWIKWNAEEFYLYNPEYYPRILYYVTGISQSPMLVTNHDCWGNALLNLIRSGLTRDSFGNLLRVQATDLVVPIQVYGNKSTYNQAVEVGKPGIVNCVLNTYAGVNFSWENNTDQYAVADCYTVLNEKGIVSFPQHQGSDLRAGMAALGAGISLVEYNGIKFYIFERSVDKIVKLLNRCALVNRVGTSGTTQI